MTLALLMAAGTATIYAADTLDSVVASIGHQAITASDVEQEYRFECFLNGQWPPPRATASALASSRERLTYQMLLIREESPGPAEKAETAQTAAQRLNALRKQYGTAQVFSQALSGLRMTEPDILARIAQQEMMLLLIDQRLRPAAAPTDAEVSAYYHSNFVPEYQKLNHGAAAPPLSAVVSQIREILVQQRINGLLDQWIEELAPTARLRFHTY